MVCDRFLDSSLAYQGAARGLGPDTVRGAERAGRGRPGARPDRAALARPGAAAGRGAEDDRFEREGDALQRAVADAYAALADAEPGRFVRVDAARDPQAVHADVLAAVREAGG